MKKQRSTSIRTLLLAVSFFLSTGHNVYATTPTPEQRGCVHDEDCRLVFTNCSTCCPEMNNSTAINVNHTKDYKAIACTPAHIRDCGVPECGLDSPTATAVCKAGLCEVMMQQWGLTPPQE